MKYKILILLFSVLFVFMGVVSAQDDVGIIPITHAMDGIGFCDQNMVTIKLFDSGHKLVYGNSIISINGENIKVGGNSISASILLPSDTSILSCSNGEVSVNLKKSNSAISGSLHI